MEMDYVLELWLGEEPEYTSGFIKITMISSIVVNSYTMIDRGIMASGHIKQLALIANTIPIIVLPLVYLVLKLGFNPLVAYIVNVIPQFLGLFATLWINDFSTKSRPKNIFSHRPVMCDSIFRPL